MHLHFTFLFPSTNQLSTESRRALLLVLLDLVVGVHELAAEVVEHAGHGQPQRADHLARHAVRARLGHQPRVAALNTFKLERSSIS